MWCDEMAVLTSPRSFLMISEALGQIIVVTQSIDAKNVTYNVRLYLYTTYFEV